jgi:Xaa-Pro aminopeptidase
MFSLPRVQDALAQFQFDGWLLYDFRGSNVLARRVLDFVPQQFTSRRFAYFVPAKGTPRKLVHRIEAGALDHLPGDKVIYLRWQEFEEGLRSLTQHCPRLALEYSPRNGNPYVAKVDAGTVELLRSFGCELHSSGDLIQLFEAVWDEEQWQMHRQAEAVTTSAYDRAWQFIADQVRAHGSTRETVVQQVILDHFAAHNVVTDHAPIVAVGPHSGDPHYAPSAENDGVIRAGEFVLIDLWGKLNQPRAVFSDLTRVGFVGEQVPEKYAAIFRIVAAARDAAIDRVRSAFAKGEPLFGWQVDDAARQVIAQAGYGAAFVHRLGHNIGQETHGNGANMDNLETREERRVLPGTCFSIEPGIYLPEFGVRSEVNVFVDWQGTVHVTGGPLQQEVLPVLAGR